jgi:hypothetical protein
MFFALFTNSEAAAEGKKYNQPSSEFQVHV